MAQLFKYQIDDKIKGAMNVERIRVSEKTVQDGEFKEGLSRALTRSVFSPSEYDSIQAHYSVDNKNNNNNITSRLQFFLACLSPPQRKDLVKVKTK